MFSLIPSDANDPQGLMLRKAPNKQTNVQAPFHKQHDIIVTEFGTYEKEYNSEFVFRDMNTLLHLKDSMVF